MKKSIKQILFYVVLIAIVIIVCVMLFAKNDAAGMKYSDVVEAFKTGQVESFTMGNDNVLNITFKDGSAIAEDFGSQNKDGKFTASYKVVSLSLFHADLGELITQQMADGTIEKGEYKPAGNSSLWLSFLPSIIILLLLVGLFIYYMVSAGGGKGGKMNSFGRARVKTPARARIIYFIVFFISVLF